MQAPFEMTEGLTRLRRIIEEFPSESSHWNEAQNRFQFIDRLLTECLGWEKPHIQVEHAEQDGGKADYIFGLPVKAVLEAKRQAKSFGNLPSGKPTVVRKLSPLLQASNCLSEAASQVLQYCVLRGAPIAIVCNGPQLVAFQALTPGLSPLEGECYCFNGFDDYTDHFPLLWSILSPEGITENRAYQDLARHRNPRIPSKASEFIPEPNKYRFRNSFQENLRELSSLLLTEIEDNPNTKSSFYKECYVQLEANNRHLLLSKRIIINRYRRIGEDGVSPSAMDALSGIEQNNDLNFDDSDLQSISGSRPVVILGDVGVGKTSFFENLYEKLEHSEKVNTYFIHLNLGLKANLDDNIKEFVLSEVPKVLREEYGVDIDSADFANAVHYKEMSRFDQSVKGQLKNIDPKAYEKEKIKYLDHLLSHRSNHLQASISHLTKGRGKRIILVIDNADQRSMTVQQEAFLIAQELAATRNPLVFVALRPSTFYSSKTKGALSAYQNKIFTISPPPADKVVLERLTFAVRVAEGKVAPASLDNIRLQLDSVVFFLRATLRSIRKNEEIRRFLSNISGGNTRSVIELITAFVGSPNVDSKKIVDIEDKTGNYVVPLHEFTKHALLGDYAYFNAQSSLVACNIFDVSMADSREHFLISVLISYLSSNMGIRDSDGYLSGLAILSELRRYGYLEDQIFSALRRAASKKLIETPYAHYRELDVPDNESPIDYHYRATSVGIYHVRYWTGEFAFLDATSIDTPIFDEEIRNKVSDLAASYNIGDRFQRSTTFKSYLLKAWHQSNIGAEYYDFPGLLELQKQSFIQVSDFIEKKFTKKNNHP